MKVLFTLMQVPWTADSNSWQFFPPKIVIGVIIALVALPDIPIFERPGWGLVYGVALLTVMIVHITGHILASKLVSPPMSEARIMPTLIETRFDNDQPNLPGRVHLTRSLGGPLINLVAALFLMPVWMLTGHHLASFLMWANLIFALVVLLPFKGIDGGVIWPILLRRNGGRKTP
jgi:hypothetical protein